MNCWILAKIKSKLKFRGTKIIAIVMLFARATERVIRIMSVKEVNGMGACVLVTRFASVILFAPAILKEEEEEEEVIIILILTGIQIKFLYILKSKLFLKNYLL